MADLYIPECPEEVATDRPRIATDPRTEHNRDHRRRHCNHGESCDCSKCEGARSRAARQDVPMYDAPVKASRRVKRLPEPDIDFDAVVDARNDFDAQQVLRDRSRYAVGKWGITH